MHITEVAERCTSQSKAEEREDINFAELRQGSYRNAEEMRVAACDELIAIKAEALAVRDKFWAMKRQFKADGLEWGKMGCRVRGGVDSAGVQIVWYIEESAARGTKRSREIPKGPKNVYEYKPAKFRKAYPHELDAILWAEGIFKILRRRSAAASGVKLFSHIIEERIDLDWIPNQVLKEPEYET